MSKTKLGSNAIFLGGSKTLSIIGNKCYAYSGTMTIAGETKTALDFASPKQIIYAKLFLNYNSASFGAGERIGYNVFLNDVEIVEAVYGDNVQAPTSAPYELELVIPPLTQVKVTLTTTDSSNMTMGMILVGDVLG